MSYCTAFDLGHTLPRPDAVAAVDALLHRRLLLHDAGLPRPVPQHKVADPQGRFIGRVDLAYPQWRIAIEDGGDHHRGRATW
ncbi:hypothetical protein O7621_11285 [Solwaraspora sp. WMMD937]|uniref:hypothetical protein n=1 Tax=Solwaraspora sp. WMMD937 TaxID=3016090 RepID=UPI00249BA992|nr:hypothetical protein [Solwaraspora sp. WMMD937]WFE23794.1 hypothetical protein O7621_11285 [Solwaraspora sp. WMMD937]